MIIKESAIVSVIGLADLMYNADKVTAATFNAFGVYIVAAIIYFILTSFCSKLVSMFERRLIKMLKIHQLSKFFNGKQILKSIDLEIKEGEIVTIIGPSGSGKSTLLRCMNLLEVPEEGQVIFEGTDLLNPKTNLNEIREQIGMVFQNFNLFPNKNGRREYYVSFKNY